MHKSDRTVHDLMNEMDTDQNGLLRCANKAARRTSFCPALMRQTRHQATADNHVQQPTCNSRPATRNSGRAAGNMGCALSALRPHLRLSLLLRAAPTALCHLCNAMRCNECNSCKCSHEELKVGLKRIGLDVDDKKFDQVRRSPLKPTGRTQQAVG